jgi:ABC-type transport system involved in multi-copper enzyme maturation permease subunit
MLRLLVKKEILDSLLNQRFIALAIFSVILMPLSAFINVEYYQARKDSFDSQKSAFEAREPSSYNLRAFHGPVLLSSLARGTEPYMPVYYSFSNDATATRPGNIEAQDFSTLSTFGSLDFLFIVQIVFSLLAILLAFDMIAGEKERGTLRAVLANRVPRDVILMGKFIGGFAVLWSTFLIGTLLLFLVLVVHDSRFMDPEMMARFGLIFLVSSLFLASFFCMGLMVSAFCHSTRTSIVALLVTWVVLQLVIPKAGEKIAAVALPISSEESVRVARSTVVKDLSQEMREKAGNLYIEITGEQNLNRVFDFVRSGTPDGDRFLKGYQEIASEYDRRERSEVRKLDQEHERERIRQQRLSRRIALLSPSSALTFLVTDVAGTGDLSAAKYRESVDNQYQIIDATIFSHQRSNRFEVSLGNSTWMGDIGQSDPPSLDDIPAFEVSDPSLVEVVNHNVESLISLFVYLIVPFLISYVAFLRYDVR